MFSPRCSQAEAVYKIILVGDAGVGKTHLLRSLLSLPHDDDDDIPSTIGVEFHTLTVTGDDGTRIKAHIWDTAGQERYHSIVKSHYRKADGVVLIYDVNDPQSFDHAVGRWLDDVKAYTEEADHAAMLEGSMLLGNKSDLPERISKTQEAIAADRAGIQMMARASAKTGEGVREAFETLLRQVHNVHRRQTSNPQPSAATAAAAAAASRTATVHVAGSDTNAFGFTCC